MKFGSQDLKRLRVPIAVCIALAITGLASQQVAVVNLRETAQQHTAITAQRNDVQAKLSSATEEEREIKANLQQYQALAARGIIGEENRLDWIDAITAIKSERRLFNINYNIERQKDLDYPGFTPAGGVKFVASRVKMDLQLLHEEDLLNFIDDLGKRSKLYLSTRGCSIIRADRSGSGTSLAPRLEAQCVFDLITIQHPKPA